jgi:hypothetical protein
MSNSVQAPLPAHAKITVPITTPAMTPDSDTVLAAHPADATTRFATSAMPRRPIVSSAFNTQVDALLM